MKKLVAVSIILALFSSVAFTQEIGFNTFNHAVFVPLRIHDGDDKSGTDNAWSTFGPQWMGPQVKPIRTALYISGATESAGFLIGMGYDSAQAFADVDNAKFWIKPVSMLKLTYGIYEEDFLRGKVGDFSNFAFAGATGGSVRDPDTIFNRFKAATGTNSNGSLDFRGGGFHLALTPIEGLFIGADVDMGKATSSNTSYGNNPPHGDDVWADNLQVALGYTIANVGLVRAQYMPRGGRTGEVANNGTIEAAFAFTGMEGLTLDVGAKIPLYGSDTSPNASSAGVKDNKVHGRKLFEAAVGADFLSGDFGIKAMVDLRFFADETYSNSDKDYLKTADFYAYLMPSYNLGAFKVGGEIGFNNKASTKWNSDKTKYKAAGAMDLGAWIAKPVAGGEFQIGVMLGLPFGDYAGTPSSTTATKDGQVSFSIPVSATVTF